MVLLISKEQKTIRDKARWRSLLLAFHINRRIELSATDNVADRIVVVIVIVVEHFCYSESFLKQQQEEGKGRRRRV